MMLRGFRGSRQPEFTHVYYLLFVYTFCEAAVPTTLFFDDCLNLFTRLSSHNSRIPDLFTPSTAEWFTHFKISAFV